MRIFRLEIVFWNVIRFSFTAEIANSFFIQLRNRFNGSVVLEPRHLSWAQLEAVNMLQACNIERVVADPLRVPVEWDKQLFKYYRLHGSPEIYSSSYNAEFLNQLATNLNNSSWVIFDNSKFGTATKNALELKQMMDA